MQQWEYCRVRTATEQPSAIFYQETGRVLLDLKHDESKGDTRNFDAGVRFIAELGIDGWELVSVDEGSWYFKRPKP